MASPRPGTAAGKTLAHKSPATATKTPASTHGHFQGLSASSQPSSTPLAAAAIHDELLNLNSPATALINSIAQNGLTPLGGGQDGLGISSHGQIDAARDGQVARTSAEERLYRVQQAIDNLKRKIVGRGITREGIERVARLHRFEALWDEDNLVIAGNMVEIEISFDSISKDRVRDLSLKLNYDDEQHVQRDGTTILKAQAGVVMQDGQQQMTDLVEFAHNIRYLAQLDPIEVKPNSFQLVGNLYESFQKIWKEEKKRMQWRTGLHHIRHGSLGVPNMDQSPDLGLTLGYWCKESFVQEDGDSATADTPPALAQKDGLWRAKVICEGGLPFLNGSKDWVSSEVLTEGQPGQNVLDASDSSYKPDWHDFTAGVDIKADGKDEAGVDTDKGQVSLPEPLHAHFACDLQPEIFLPLNAISRFNNEVSMIDADPQRTSTYHRALQQARDASLGKPEQAEVEKRWTRRLPVVDSNGRLTYTEHSYRLYPSTQDAELWCYPVTRIRFSHPRQLAEILPMLRQYAVVWSILRTLVDSPPKTEKPTTHPKINGEKRIFKRSNKTSQGTTANAVPDSSALDADILFDPLSDSPKARLEIFAPVSSHIADKAKDAMLHLTILVSPGGHIQVTTVEGVDNGDLSGLKTKLSKMLSSTEDVGIVLQWLVEKGRKKV